MALLGTDAVVGTKLDLLELPVDSIEDLLDVDEEAIESFLAGESTPKMLGVSMIETLFLRFTSTLAITLMLLSNYKYKAFVLE